MASLPSRLDLISLRAFLAIQVGTKSSRQTLLKEYRVNRSMVALALTLTASLVAAPPAKKPVKKTKATPTVEPSPMPAVQAEPVKPKITKAEVIKASIMSKYTAEQEVMLDGAKTPLLTCKILLALHRDNAEVWWRERNARLKRHNAIKFDAITTPALTRLLPETEAAIDEAERERDNFLEAVKALTELKARIEAEEASAPQQ